MLLGVTVATQVGNRDTADPRAAGHDARQLAKRAKVTRSYIALIETGRKKNPSLDIRKRPARALGVPVTERLQ